MPTQMTTPPMMAKIQVQLSLWFRSKPMKPPKTTRMEIRGIMELMPSTAPRLVRSVESVTQALKAASLALEPKKVMTQSMMMTRLTPRAMALAVMGKTASITSTRSRQKLRMLTPHTR